MSFLIGPVQYYDAPADPQERTSDARQVLGTFGYDSDGRELMYVRGSGITVATYSLPVTVKSGLDFARGATDGAGFDGFAEASFGANEYGYIVKRGTVSNAYASGVAVGDRLLPTTAGKLIPATATDIINRACLAQEATVVNASGITVFMQ